MAAKKMANYWEQRYRLFGPEKFFLPLTLKGALSEDSLALSRGYVQLLPCNDSAGRAVIFMDWSCHEPGVGYDQSSMVRINSPAAHDVTSHDAVTLKRFGYSGT